MWEGERPADKRGETHARCQPGLVQLEEPPREGFECRDVYLA